MSRQKITKAELEKQVATLKRTLAQAITMLYRETCPHEELTRGGAIWTFCTACGAQWADDRGGFKPNPLIKEIESLEEVLNAIV